ncbi:cytochrome b-c1 complex subunit 7-like [Glossophaga mutica]
MVIFFIKKYCGERPVKRASRPTAAASSRWLDGTRKRYYGAAGFSKPGPTRDDTIHVSDDVNEAIRSLPENLCHDRVFRIERALDLKLLAKEQWTKYEEDKPYLEPHLKEVIRERKEREEWAKKESCNRMRGCTCPRYFNDVS